MLVAARDAEVGRFVYAASSSAYGDHPGLPKVEDQIGRPLSPYAATKHMNELYADVFGAATACRSIGLRYFNVFGARQDPDGAYAAVIPNWVAAMLARRADASSTATARPAATSATSPTWSRPTCSRRSPATRRRTRSTTSRSASSTSLIELFGLLATRCRGTRSITAASPVRRLPPGDVRHSLADISKARALLGYAPTHSITEGIEEALALVSADGPPHRRAMNSAMHQWRAAALDWYQVKLFLEQPPVSAWTRCTSSRASYCS